MPERFSLHGIGTPFVESLTSAVRRLAEFETRTVAVLLDIHVRRALRGGGRSVPTFIAGSLTEAVNGSTRLTAMIVEGLARAFNLPELARTTLLGTAGELFSERDFRPVRAWCPSCLKDSGYDQLSWSLSGVVVCVRHGVKLVTFPLCGHEHAPWVQRASSLECPSCGLPLSEAAVETVEVDALTAAYVHSLNWFQQGGILRRGAVAAGVRAAMAERGITPASLSRGTGLSIHTIGSLRTGRTAPELSSIAALLAFTGARLDDLTAHGELEPVARRIYQRPQRSRHPLDELERVLRHEALLPREQRRNLAVIGASLGVGAQYARAHFPELARVWSDPTTRRWGRRKPA